MCGYLAILYSALRGAGTDDNNDGDFDWFSEYKRLAAMDRLPSPPPYELLQLKAFVSLFVRGYLAPRAAYWALPVIMRMICLRRDIGDPADGSDSGALIGDGIPAMRIMSVDIKHPERIHRDHNIRFAQLMAEMKRNPQEGAFGLDSRRRADQTSTTTTAAVTGTESNNTARVRFVDLDDVGIAEWDTMDRVNAVLLSSLGPTDVRIPQSANALTELQRVYATEADNSGKRQRPDTSTDSQSETLNPGKSRKPREKRHLRGLDGNPLDLKRVINGTRVDISLAELLDVAPAARVEFAKLMRKSSEESASAPS